MEPHGRWANTRYFLALRERCRRRASQAPVGGAVVRLEGYTQGGAAVLVDCRSSDPAHTRARLRQLFVRHGGHLGAQGSVAYLFHPVAVFLYPPASDAQCLRRLAWAAGAEDFIVHRDSSVEVLADPAECARVRARLSQEGREPALVEVTWRAAAAQPLPVDAAIATMGLLRDLADDPAVCAVYSNAQLPAQALAGA
jgi:transcriptional/translational regulatory protein YebC/TACO1